MRVGGGLGNVISALIKEVPQAPHSSCHVRTRREGTSNARGSGPSQKVAMLAPCYWTSSLQNRVT